MSKVKVSNFSISIDGFGAGKGQSVENPLGTDGMKLHNWIFGTKIFHKMIGKEGGAEGVDNTFMERSFENVGSWIMGRNMFGPVRGDWADEQWKGWWGANPPFHGPVFVLTHHKREPLVMEGGTTFYFITDGIHTAMEAAKTAANGKEIRISGGVSTIKQFLNAGYIDELHLALSPVFLGAGEHLFADTDISALGFNKIEKTEGENATHFIATKNR